MSGTSPLTLSASFPESIPEVCLSIRLLYDKTFSCFAVSFRLLIHHPSMSKFTSFLKLVFYVLYDMNMICYNLFMINLRFNELNMAALH